MHAVLLPNAGLRSFPPILSPAKSAKKIADFSLRLTSREGKLQWPNSTVIRSEESRRGRPPKRVSSNKPREVGEDDELKHRSKPPDNEEILALFRKIQSSISKEGKAKVPRRRRQGIADSVSPRRNQSRERSKEPERREGSELEDGKTQRPLSKFVRRSPIPVLSPFKEQSSLKKEDGVEKVQEVEGGEEKGDGSEVLEMQKIDGLKLSELKELARGKGIKGFSRLKKGELLQLLKERLKASS